MTVVTSIFLNKEAPPSGASSFELAINQVYITPMKNKVITTTTVESTPIKPVTRVFKAVIKSTFDFMVYYFRLYFIQDYNPKLLQERQKNWLVSVDGGKLSVDGQKMHLSILREWYHANAVNLHK